MGKFQESEVTDKGESDDTLLWPKYLEHFKELFHWVIKIYETQRPCKVVKGARCNVNIVKWETKLAQLLFVLKLMVALG